MAKLTPEALNELISVYVGYFNRAPDPQGLQFYIDKLEAEPPTTDIETIATNFANSPEALAQYPYLATPGLSSTTAFITSIYQNLFNRAPDADGLAYWEDKLDSGVRTPGEMILAIIKGAVEGDDKAIIDNKIAAALDFVTDAANTPGFEFDDAAKQAAKDALSNITADEQSVTDAATATDAFLAGETTVGSTFTLTPDLDQFTGTAANDTFQGELSGEDDDNGFTSFDDLVGGAGQDTLNIVVSGSGGTIPGTVDISGIEVINFDLSSPGAGVSGGIDASVFVGAEQIWQIGGEGEDISELAEGQTAGFRDIDADGVTVTAAAGAESISVALDGVVGDADFALSGGDVTTLNFSGSFAGTGESALNLTAEAVDLPKVETITLAMTSDTEVNSNGTALGSLVTIDASASTGDIKVTLIEENFIPVDALVIESIETGSGADNVEVDLSVFGADAVALNLGGGNDHLVLDGDVGDSGGATAMSITLGDGEDLLELTELGNIETASEAAFEDSLITVEDFSMTNDVLDISTFAPPVALTNQQLSDIANADDLFAAVTEAAGLLGSGGVAAFDYAGDAYILNSANAAFDAGDGLIKLVGVSIEDFDSSNYVTSA